MQLNLGIKIRELRRRDGRTQENIAESLGVTAQAVSRWESGGSYPDMEMIPAIANYFHVSIDELFGYHDEREEKIKTILENATKILTKQGFTMYQGSLSDDVEECVNMLRAASEEFPNEPKILMKLAQALHMWGWNKYGGKVHLPDSSGVIEYDIEYNSKNIYWQEAVRVYEKLLKSNPSAEDREKAIRQITPLYCCMGEYEKAKALAKAQSSLVVCREVLLPLATTGKEKSRYLGERIVALLVNLRLAVLESIAINPNITESEYEKQLHLSIINLYETIFSDGRFGKWHWDVCASFLDLVQCEAAIGGNIEDILEYFDKAFYHIAEYKRIYNEGEDEFTAPMLSSLKRSPKEDIPPLEKDFWKKQLRFWPKNVCDEIQKNPKYSECFE